jgi:outer membrane protein TolC
MRDLAAVAVMLALIACWVMPLPCQAVEPRAKSGQALGPEDMYMPEGKRKVPLRLLDAVRIGLAQNPDIKIALLNRASQLMDLKLAERMFEPEFFINGGYTHQVDPSRDNRTLGLLVRKKLMTAGELSFNWEQANTLDREDNQTQDSSTLSLTLSQPLLRGAGVTVGTAEQVTARNTEQVNALGFKSLIIDKITSIQKAYWDLLLAMETRLSTVRAFNASRELLKRNKALIKAGRMAKADLVQTEQEVARSRVDILEQELAVETANRSLVDLLDLEQSVAVLPVEGFVYRKVEVEYKSMVAKALKINPDIINYQIALRQSELDLTLARSQAKDQLDLTISTSHTALGDSPGDAWRDSLNLGAGWEVGLGFEIPLGLPRDRLRHQVAVSERSVKAAKINLARTKRNVRQLVRDVSFSAKRGGLIPQRFPAGKRPYPRSLLRG